MISSSLSEIGWVVFAFAVLVVFALLVVKGGVRRIKLKAGPVEASADSSPSAADVRQIVEAIGVPNGKGSVMEQMKMLWSLNEKIDRHNESLHRRLDRQEEHRLKLSRELSEHISAEREDRRRVLSAMDALTSQARSTIASLNDHIRSHEEVKGG